MNLQRRTVPYRVIMYPAGESAGYASGIMSAAIDSIEVAEALERELLMKTTFSISAVEAR